MIEDYNLRVDPRTAATPRLLRAELLRAASLKPEDLHDMRIVRRSIDARQRRVMVNLTVRAATGEDHYVPSLGVERPVFPKPTKGDVVIVGAGPAGLFAAIEALKLGWRPVVLERGANVDERRHILAGLSREGKVDPDTNYCFGEGGAGAYSDGKLYTRSKKRGNVEEVLRTFVAYGANPEILIDAHPHIGSDRLPGIIRSMRAAIIAGGGEVRFHTKVTGLIMEGDEVKGVRTDSGQEYLGPVVLATGHSARDVYRMLHASGVELEAKGLAIGVRLEHPQHLIDQIQYHDKEGRGQWLPAAEYSFVTQADGRGVYSFCMCPGGVVVPAASGPEQSAVNGMSASARASRWANSGMVVEVRPGDFPEYEQYGVLQLMHLQEDLERNFYQAAGGTLQAPAQRMADFCASRVSSSLPETSYLPGLRSLPLHFLLPPFIAKRLQAGLRKFGQASRGFLTNDAVLIGLESRTSSPVRIPRSPQTMTHTRLQGLYPAGEGAGYAGGIVSAAIDGIRALRALNENVER